MIPLVLNKPLIQIFYHSSERKRLLQFWYISKSFNFASQWFVNIIEQCPEHVNPLKAIQHTDQDHKKATVTLSLEPKTYHMH